MHGRHPQPFHFGDVGSGEPHLYLSRQLSDDSDLREYRDDARGMQFKSDASIHLPRLLAIASGAAALLLMLVTATMAESPQPPSRWLTSACAERDLKVLGLIEEHGDAWDLPPAVLGEAGLAHLGARMTCLEGRPAEALVKYDAILTAISGTARQAQ